MPLQEYTVDKNTAHVEQAHVDMSAAQVDNVEHRAKAEVVTAKEEGGRAQQAEHQAAVPGNNAESKFYGDVAADAMGLKVISTVAEFLNDKLDSNTGGPAKNLGGLAPANARSADDFFFGNAKTPGVFRAPVETSVFGVVETGLTAKTPANVTPLRRSTDTSAGLIERSGSTAQSLRDQDGSDATSTWTGVDRRMNAVQEAKRMTFGRELASEQALESVKAVRAQHSAQIGQAQQYSPGMGLGSGPSIRPQDLLTEAREQYIDTTGTGA